MGCNKSPFNVTIEGFHPGVTGTCLQVCVQYPSDSSTPMCRFLVDCGMFQEKEYINLNDSFPFYPDKIDFVLVTHTHLDHIGRIPLLVKKGFTGPIYSSATNCSFMHPALEDTAKILRNMEKIKNVGCLYTESDVDNTEKQFQYCAWEESVKYNENIKFTFFKNGHLVGSTLILVQLSYPDQEDINLLFTGDYCSSNVFLNVRSLPNWVLDLPLTIVIESTYGNRESNDVNYCFDSNIAKAMYRHATVIAPVFSQGRAQEVLHELKCMQENKTLDIGIPIFLDGNLAIKFTERYRKCNDVLEHMKNFLPINTTFVDKTIREPLLNDPSRKIILTSSGMGSYGPAQLYLPEYFTRPNALIHFTGYCAPGTLGYKMKTALDKEPVEIGGRMLRKYSQVEYTSEFSAHSKANQLIDFLQQFSNLKLVMINHGTPEVKREFASRVINEVHTKDVCILGDAYTFRVNGYGFVKSLPSSLKVS